MIIKYKKYIKGFTLLEILLVIAAIGILAAIVLVAINPNRQLAQARNAQRKFDINTINKSLEQFLIDTSSYPSQISNTYQEICATGSKSIATSLTDNPSVDCTNKLDLRVLVPTYIASIPRDPQSTGSSTGYYIAISSVNNRISIKSLNADISINVPLLLPDSNISLVMNCNGANFTDSSVYNRVISIEQGAPAISTIQSKFGGSSCFFPNTPSISKLNFNDSPELELTGDFTVETWIYPLSSAGQTIAGHSSQNVQMFRLNEGGAGTLSFFLNGTQVFFPTAAGIAANNWYHLAITRSGSTTRMFVNGVRIGAINNGWTGSFKINNIGTTMGGQYNGYVDDFRITKGVARYIFDFTPPIVELANNDYVPAIPPSTVVSSNISLLMNCNKFDLGFIDSSTYQRSIRIEQGNPNYSTTQSKFGGASCFLPNASRLNFDDSAELELTGDFTVETWAYPLSSAGQTIAGHSSQNVQIFRLNEGGAGTLSFFLNGTQVFFPTAAGIAANNWYHLAITRSGSTTRMFVNGVQIGSSNNGWTSSFKINNIGNSWGGAYNGYIDDFRITKGVARYISNFTPPTSQLAD